MIEPGRVRSDLDPCELCVSYAEMWWSGLLGGIIYRKVANTFEQPAAAWICSITCSEKKKP